MVMESRCFLCLRPMKDNRCMQHVRDIFIVQRTVQPSLSLLRTVQEDIYEF